MNLTQKVLSYQCKSWELSNILIDLHFLAERWLRLKWHWTKEKIDDFFTFLSPKLSRMVGKYRYNGKAFERYYAKMLNFQIRTYLKKTNDESRHHRNLKIGGREHYNIHINNGHLRFDTSDSQWPESIRPDAIITEPQRVLQNDPLTSPELLDSNVMNLSSKKKRLLLLALKKSSYWNDTDIRELSRETGLQALHLLGMRQEAFEFSKRKLDKREAIRERYNKALYGLKYKPPGNEKQKRLEKCKDNAFQQIQKLAICPSHRELATITGIPKGTIDSNLFNHKRNCLKD